MTRPLRRVLLLPALVALAALPWALDRLVAAPESLLLGRAQFAETIDDDRAAERALPHRWQTDCVECRTAWYRFDLEQSALPAETQAVYLPAQGNNVAVYLNGRLIGQGGRFADPVARLGPRPLLASAPAAMWNPGYNRLYVLVKAGRAGAGFMPAPALGAESVLERTERSRTFLAVTIPQVLAAAVAMLGLTMGAVWFYRRRELDYAVLAAATIAWTVHAFSSMLVETPWHAALWDGWLAAAAATAAAALWAVTARLRGAPGHSLSVGALGAGIASFAAIAEPSGAVADAASTLALGVFAITGLQLAWACRARSPLLLCGGAFLAAAAVHDLAAAARFLPPDVLPALPLAAPLLLGLAGWILLLRFVDTLNAVEVLNIDLEAMVQARTAELHSQFERVRELERERIIAAERERLMRDMHDGVGGHLVSMLAMLEAGHRQPGELATTVRDALDDMRLMIDSLEPVDDDLNAVLGMWRDRLAPRLRGAGVELHWDVDLLPMVQGLTPARVLHVLRMLQEAVTNAIRHGRARTLWIGAATAPEGVRIEVRDDGGGFDPQAVASGRGLANLKRRAAEVGATLDIVSEAGRGATVALLLPRG